MSETKTNKKARTWTLVIYPESAPKNWREIIDKTHISWIESPLHDKDVNPDGTIKKAHWHVLLLFEGPTTFSKVKDIGKVINAPVPQIVSSARGMVRYMIHMDNPEKYQYPIGEIVGHGGADVDGFFELTATNRLRVLQEITAYIQDNKVTSFADLTYHAIETSTDWFDVIANHNTLFLNKLIDSEWQKAQSKQE
jgi:hypothetical protein